MPPQKNLLIVDVQTSQKGKEFMTNILDRMSNAVGGVIDKAIGKDDVPLTPPAPAPVQPPAPDNQTAQPPAIVPNQTTTPAEQSDVVSGTFIDATQPVPVPAISRAAEQTAQFQQVINSFDEDKQAPMERITTALYTVLAYAFPPITAAYVGAAIGDAFSGPFNLGNAWSVYAHLISITLELMLPILGLAVVVSFKRSLKDRSQLPTFITLALLFLVLGIGNSCAQLFLIDQHISTGTNVPAMFGVYFRAFGPMIIDVISAAYLAVVGVRSLKKYLADQREKITAVRDVSAIHIELDQAHLKAAMDKQNAIMEMQSKAQRAATWNEIEQMQSKAMIEQARRNMGDQGNEGGSYRRGRY